MISNLGLVIVDGKLRFCNNNEYKEQVLTCLNCGAKYKFPRIAFIVPQEDMDATYDIGEMLISIKLNEYPNCLKCHSNELELLDVEIADALISLNKKGFKTLASCAGHHYEKYNFSYIMFNKEAFDILFKNVPAPEHWYYDNTDFGNISEDPDKVEIYIDSSLRVDDNYINEDESTRQDHHNMAMQSLSTWALNLKDLSAYK